MKISPIQIEVENVFNRRERTLLIAFLNFETLWHSTSLFEIGWFDGWFYFEILFSNLIINKIKEKLGL